MQKTILVLMALLTIAGPAMAGGDLHFAIDANGESHTVDASLGEDGSATVLVDGQPVGAPELPAAPEVPTLP